MRFNVLCSLSFGSLAKRGSSFKLTLFETETDNDLTLYWLVNETAGALFASDPVPTQAASTIDSKPKIMDVLNFFIIKEISPLLVKFYT